VGAGTGSGKLDLSTDKAVYAYLRSLGVNPATVVIQRGTRNYAGPNCPGRRWNCTTARRVIQIGTGPRRSSGAQRSLAPTNTVECTGVPMPTNTATAQTCVIVQMNATSNTARCVEKSDSPAVAQTCTITQTGADNDAYVRQVINTSGASTSGMTQTQNNRQDANITQKGVENSADVGQDVYQSLQANGPVTQNQDAHQFVEICQGGTTDCTTANTGTNSAKVHQQRFGKVQASGGVIDQNQDVSPGGDCSPAFPTAPNLCADIVQNSSTRNDTDLHQDGHLLASATGTEGEDVTQKQQLPDHGIDGHVMQPEVSDADNDKLVHQHLTDDMSGPQGSSQSQDPGMGCCSAQQGNTSSKTEVHQVGHLRASENSAVQQLDITGNTGSNGACTILQVGKINGANFTTKDSEDASEYPAFCSAFIECESAGEIDSTSAQCFGFPPKGNVPDESALLALGFDTLDLQDALNFQFPIAFPPIGL
jgi:hypothetical protein